MTGTENIRCAIRFQKEKHIYAELPRNTKRFLKDGLQIQVLEEKEGDCRIGKLSLNIKNESCRENANLDMENPITIWLPLERPEKITAMYLFNEWWTRPAFAEKFQEIPDRTQVVFFKYENRYACMVTAVGENFKTYLTAGTEDEVCLKTTAGLGGQNSVDEPLYLIAEAPGFYEAVHKAFVWLADYKGIRMREERRLPEMFRYLG